MNEIRGREGKLLSLFILITAMTTTACDRQAQNSSRPLTQLESMGKAAYMSNCIACHNPDPRVPGSIGPEIAFSSLELIKERVTKAQYPKGYTPKRQSKMMPAFPQLESDVLGLHAYLNSFTK